MKSLNKLYLTQCDEKNKIHFQMFHKIFINEFNIGISSPASDCCAKCTNLKYQIKVAKTHDGKLNPKLELRFYKKRANTFYELMK